MASATVDHMLSLTVFIVALLIFIGMFSQNIQTGITYQQHTGLSTKTGDLIDTVLLNPGIPDGWGQSDGAPLAFGLQNPEFTQYKLSSYSPMRLVSYTGSQVYYPGTGGYYSNLTAGFGSYLLTPTSENLNYSTASKLLGINGTYGFQLSLTPTVAFSIQKTSTGTPLTLSVNVAGTGYPLANTPLTYSLIVVNADSNDYPSYRVITGTNQTDAGGNSPPLTFAGVDGENQAYAFIVYSYIDGLTGMGYYVHVPSSSTKTVVPLVASFQNQTVTIAHGDSVGQPPQSPTYSQVSYNATFVIVTDDYTLRQVTLNQPNATGKVTYAGSGVDHASINLPNNEGILIVSYKDNSGRYGVVLAPWGLGSMAFPLTFGGAPAGQNWVSTDIRQVTVSGISYQAKLMLWSIQGYQEGT